MPCRDDYAAECNQREQLERLDTATRLLCEVCKKIYAIPGTTAKQAFVSNELGQWYGEHLKMDAQREAQERQYKITEATNLLKQQAENEKRLAQLRKELGLKPNAVP